MSRKRTSAQPKSISPATHTKSRGTGTIWIVAGLIALVSFAVYAPTGSHRYISVDDGDYVFDNPNVSTGLTAANVIWAFTTGHAANWHPLTWLSHMIDCQCFGTAPGPQHLVNAALHSLDAATLFLGLFAFSGMWKQSALVAALFG